MPADLSERLLRRLLRRLRAVLRLSRILRRILQDRRWSLRARGWRRDRNRAGLALVKVGNSLSHWEHLWLGLGARSGCNPGDGPRFSPRLMPEGWVYQTHRGRLEKRPTDDAAPLSAPR